MWMLTAGLYNVNFNWVHKIPAGCVALFTTHVQLSTIAYIYLCQYAVYIQMPLKTIYCFFLISPSPTVLQWLTSCWCWMERQGMCGCLLVDQWDWEAQSEAPPQESPRSDTALYSSSPCGGQEILSMTSFKTLWFREPILSCYNIEIFLAIKKKRKKKDQVPFLCWCAGRPHLQTVA